VRSLRFEVFGTSSHATLACLARHALGLAVDRRLFKKAVQQGRSER
jgi:hypothetical protein